MSELTLITLSELILITFALGAILALSLWLRELTRRIYRLESICEKLVYGEMRLRDRVAMPEHRLDHPGSDNP